MKAIIEVEVPDWFLAGRVGEFNAETARGDGRGFRNATPDSYLREHVEGLCHDEIPVALFGWPVEARVVSVE